MTGTDGHSNAKTGESVCSKPSMSPSVARRNQESVGWGCSKGRVLPEGGNERGVVEQAAGQVGEGYLPGEHSEEDHATGPDI